MAKIARAKKFKKDEVFPFERQNYLIIGTGLLFIVAGYVALMEKTVEGFLPLYVAPILLVLGYCVLIPLGILYTKRAERTTEEQHQTNP